MKVSYRIVEEANPNGDWETVGVIAVWHDDLPHMQLRGMLLHTVSRSIWGKIRQRVAERKLTLETYHEAIGEYSSSYRIRPEIHQITAETHSSPPGWAVAALIVSAPKFTKSRLRPRLKSGAGCERSISF
jgi:hypothetical protein